MNYISNKREWCRLDYCQIYALSNGTKLLAQKNIKRIRHACLYWIPCWDNYIIKGHLYWSHPNLDWFSSKFIFEVFAACLACRRLCKSGHYMRREKNQLDATEWLTTLIICSTFFGHFYAHHQELEPIRVFLSPMVCNALVAGGRRSGAGSRPCVRDECCSSHNFHSGLMAYCLHLTSDHQQPRLCTP